MVRFVLLSVFPGGLLSAATVGPTGRFIPLVQDGGGWSAQVTVVNLSEKPETVLVAFIPPGGFAEEWRLGIKATKAKVAGTMVDAIRLLGAVSVFETSGTPEILTRVSSK